MNIHEARVKPLAYRFGRQTIRLPRWFTIVGTVALVFGLVYQMEKLVISATPRGASNQPAIQRARMSDEISVHAAGQGNPWINLSDGHELITPYSGPAELTQILERNEARPLSLCSADFDEDGVPDLISGYAGSNGGIVTLLRGNVDSIYPNAPEAKQRHAEGTFTDAPFLGPAFVFAVPEAADFIGAGDFDGDGHWDVVTAARGSNKLYLLSGDGKGGLHQTKRIDLPGGVTAMVVGEINRRDGLDDIVIGVSAEQRSKVLVFEGPEGALRVNPEIFGLPAEATSLALGQLDDSYEMDLAIAAGHELMIVHGRDRKLSLDRERQAEVAQATVESRHFPFEIRSLAIGDFAGSYENDIALLTDNGTIVMLGGIETSRERQQARHKIAEWAQSTFAIGEWAENAKLVCARVSSTPVDNLIVVDLASYQVQVIAAYTPMLYTERPRPGDDSRENMYTASLQSEAEPIAVLPMRLNRDALSDLAILRTGHTGVACLLTVAAAEFTVNNTKDSGPGSLRQAILDANASPGADTISFNIATNEVVEVPTIKPLSAMPTVTEALTIDGTTQQAGLVELSGVRKRDVDLFKTKAGNSVIRGLVMNRFSGFYTVVITLAANGNYIIEGNLIGTDSSGTKVFQPNNDGDGIDIYSQSMNNIVGGTVAAARNVFCGNGGTTLERHKRSLSEFGGGVSIQGASGNKIQGNFVGTDVTGTIDLGDDGIGILIEGCTNCVGVFNNTIGGTTAGTRNIISANGFYEISLRSDTLKGTLVQGNLIGTDFTGTRALGKCLSGVFSSASETLIGGTTLAARNVISGNEGVGRFDCVGLGITGTGNVVQGNFIGTDVFGTESLGNPTGFEVSGSNNQVGGATVGARNIISGNQQAGILIHGDRNIVQGNFIGTDVTGTLALGNRIGIQITEAREIVVGGTTVNESNIISGNRKYGVGIGLTFITTNGQIAFGETGALVQGNFIGTDATGTANLGNAQDGIFVENNSLVNTIDGNVIAFNHGSGVRIPNDPLDDRIPNNPGVQINIRSNSIFSNVAVGIDLGPAGPTPNPFNVLTGANLLQNFPELASAVLSGGAIAASDASPAAASITIAGTLTAKPTTNYTLQFFFGSSCNSGQGHQFTGAIPLLLGSTAVTTDGSGIANYNISLPLLSSVTTGGFVNSTATDPVGNTSELSQCVQVTGTPPGIGPRITSACKGDGKQLIISGSGFVDGAKVLLNGDPEKTQFVSSTQVIAFKAGKRAQTGDTLKVRNPDTNESPQVTYTRVNCSL